MAIVTKAKKLAKNAVRPSRAVVKGLSPRRTPPPAAGTVGDLLKMGADFGKGADWDVIKNAHAARNL
ncbi:MAG: hypothetical protein ABII82_18350 [Verrucomicrobiota bacterium]